MLPLLSMLILLYALLVGVIVLFQRKLMYHPDPAIHAADTYGLREIEEATLASADGTQLQCWVRAPREGFPVIVYFHGNAGNLSMRAPKFIALTDAGFGLVAVSYRGFGKSAGAPHEHGIYDDARTAVAFARMRWPAGKFIYFGESLGSGVAVRMASEASPALLALEAAYTSVETRSAELYPYILGVRRLVRDKYDSLSAIARIGAPLLMLHGARDNVIPLRHGEALFAAAKDPKKMVVYPEVYHADYSGEQIVEPLMAAAKEHGLIA